MQLVFAATHTANDIKLDTTRQSCTASIQLHARPPHHHQGPQAGHKGQYCVTTSPRSNARMPEKVLGIHSTPSAPRQCVLEHRKFASALKICAMMLANAQ
jgi:hypothetical protein